MVKYNQFVDILKQEEIDRFYTACQMHRDYYRGYSKAPHPLNLFQDPQYMWQCPDEMTHVYLGYPSFHVQYKKPMVLAQPPSRIPDLPSRSLAGRYNKKACQAYIR